MGQTNNRLGRAQATLKRVFHCLAHESIILLLEHISTPGFLHNFLSLSTFGYKLSAMHLLRPLFQRLAIGHS
ncbi:hypothetical protein SprV_0401479700 [Sparganum proliferum]